MNDMARNRRKSAGGVESRALAGKKIQAPEIQKAVSVGVTLVEENLDTGDSWFVLGPSKMEKIRQPLIGVTGFRPAVDLKYRELLDQALDEIGQAQIARCVSPDEQREVWVEAQTVKFYQNTEGEHFRLITVRNLTAEQDARTLNEKAIDRGLNHFQANLLVENLTTKTGRYVVRHARPSHEQRPLCAERRTEKMLPEERDAFLEGVSQVGGSAEYQWLMPAGHREWHRMINLGESINDNGETERLLMGFNIEDEKRRELELRRKVDQLNNLNHQLYNLASTARVGLMSTNYESGLLELDAMARELLDLPPDLYPQPTLEDYLSRVHPSEREDVLQSRSRIIHGFDGKTRVRRIVHQDGEVRHLKMNFLPKFDGERYLGCDAVLVDISDVQRANDQVKQRNAEIERATATARIGTFSYKFEDDRIELNSIARELVNLPVEQFPVLSLDLYLSAFELDNRDEARAKILERINQGVRHHKVDRKVRLEDGSLRYLEVHIERYTDPSGNLSLEGVMLDVTERVERELQMQEEQQRREQMFAVIGHELRTPAATLKMLAEQLEQCTEQGGTVSDLQQTQQMLKSTAEHLVSVLDDLRQVAQPDKQRTRERKVVQLTEFLEGIVTSLRPMAESQGFSLTFDLERADFQYAEVELSSVRQVLTNLTKNALIHSGGDRVRIAVEISANDNLQDKLHLRVLDNGKGIPADQVEQLFMPFVRGNTEADGTGLGLPICRDLIRGLGGELFHETTPSGGSSFNIEMPILRVVGGTHAESPQASVNPFEGKRVLIAEDNLTIRMLTQKMLESKGALVTVAEHGSDALERCAESKFDLILSDIFMPQMNGYEFVRALRTQGFGGPVVGLTAATIGDETENMLQAGADLIIPKPIDIRKLADWLVNQTEEVLYDTP